jgi:hypothetical protein
MSESTRSHVVINWNFSNDFNSTKGKKIVILGFLAATHYTVAPFKVHVYFGESEIDYKFKIMFKKF